MPLNNHRRAWAVLMTVSLVGLMVQVTAALAATAPPGPPMTRGQLATALMNTFQLTPASVGPLFRDVPASAPDRTAIETVSGNLLMTGVSEFSFAPNKPATRLDLAAALVNALGLKDTVQLIHTQPAVSDANQIPSSDWGIVDAALQLHLLSADSQGNFDPNGPVTMKLYQSAVAAEQGVTPTEVAGVANPVANTMWLGFPYWENASQDVNVGTRIQQIAYQVEAGELVLPGLATLTATAGTLGANGSYTAPSQPGYATVTATVNGTNITQSLKFSVYDPVRLQFDSSTPTVLTAGHDVTITGDVMSPSPGNLSSSVVDVADIGRTLTLTVTNSNGTTNTLSAVDKGGQASFSWTPQASGQYKLTLSGSGFGSVSDTVQVTPQPLATATVSLASTNLGYGQSVPVSVHLDPTSNVPLPTYLPINITSSGNGRLNNVATSVYTPAAEQPGGTVVGDLTGGPTPGVTSVTVATPGNSFVSATATANVIPLGSITATVPSTPQPAGSAVPVSAQLTLANGQPAPAGITVYFTPVAPDGEEGLLSTRSEINSAVATTNSAGIATVSLADQYMSGTYHLSVTANGYTGASTTYQIDPGSAVKLDAVVAPSPFIMAGHSASLNVSAVDQYGNIVPGFSMPVKAVFHGEDGRLQVSSTQVDGKGTVGTVTAGNVRGTDKITVTSPAFPGQVMNLPVTVITQPDQLLEGKGTWATYGVYGSMGAQGMINAMKADGITHLYLETAASGAGFYGQLPFDSIVDLAHQNGIAVINWTYAALWNLPADEADAKAALSYKTQLGSMTDGYTGDFEENLNASTMKQYSQFIRSVIGPNEPYVATIYPPQDDFNTPLSTLAPYVTAFAPMDYWHGMEQDYTFGQVYNYVTDSINEIKAAAPGIPIEVIAEAYDMWSDSETGVYNPSAVEEEAAMLAASNGGAAGISFYDLGTMSPEETEVISRLSYPVVAPPGSELPDQGHPGPGQPGPGNNTVDHPSPPSPAKSGVPTHPLPPGFPTPAARPGASK